MQFETWTFAGKQYLAVPSQSGVHIIDADGNNYGSWMSVDGFRKRQRDGGEWSALGSARIMVVLDNSPLSRENAIMRETLKKISDGSSCDYSALQAEIVLANSDSATKKQ